MRRQRLSSCTSMCAHGGGAGLGGVMEMVEHAGKAREG